MDKKIVEHPYNEILLKEKEVMQQHRRKSPRSQTPPLKKKKEKIICSMIPFIQNSRKYEINYSDTKQINDFLGVWGRDKREDFFLE